MYLNFTGCDEGDGYGCSGDGGFGGCMGGYSSCGSSDGGVVVVLILVLMLMVVVDGGGGWWWG